MKKTIIATNVDLMFRAFSDRNRLRILHVLQDSEMCVGDIVDVLGAPQPRVSRHLAYLRRAGLAQSRKVGLYQFYSLTTPSNEFHANLLGCLATCFSAVPELQADRRRAAKVRENGGCCPPQARGKGDTPYRCGTNSAASGCCSE